MTDSKTLVKDPAAEINATPTQQLAGPSQTMEVHFDDEVDIEEGFFVPSQEEMDELEEASKDKSKVGLVAECLGLKHSVRDRKVLLGARAKWQEVVPLLDSSNREIRVGALAALIEIARQDTLVSKKDIKILVGRLAPKTEAPRVANVSMQSHAKKPAKEDSEAVKAVKAKYPDAKDRGKDSDYAKEIRIARKI